MSFYTDVFDVRGESYNAAMDRFPDAREEERAILIEMLDPKPGELILDAPAGGGYLADGLHAAGSVPVCIEPSEDFAQPLGGRYETYHSDIFMMPDFGRPLDKAGSLAGLHHLTREQILDCFKGCYTAMKSGGVIAVADVLDGSPVATFLNGPVNEWTLTGHEGMFFQHGDFSALLSEAGFQKVEESLREFYWIFPTFDDVVSFCQLLFGLVKAEKQAIASTLTELLGIDEVEGGFGLRWSLLYAKAVK